MPTCQPGNQNRLQSVLKRHKPGSEVAYSQDTAAKEEEDEGENSKADTKQDKHLSRKDELDELAKIETSSKTKTEMGAAARVTTAPGPVLFCIAFID